MAKWTIKKAAIKKKAENIEYYVKTYWGEIDKDNYEHGEYETVKTFIDDIDVNTGNNFETPLEAANAIIEAYGFNAITDKSYWNIERDEKGLRFETSISTDLTSDGRYQQVDTNSEIYQKFKQGIIDLYVFTFVIVIGKRQQVDFDEYNM